MTRDNPVVRFFRVPGVWEDVVSFRRAEILHITHVFVFFVSFLYFLIPSRVLNGQPIFVLGAMFMMVIGSALLRAGCLRWCGIWTIGTLWLMFTAGSLTEGGINSSSFAGTLAIVVFAGLTYGVPASIAITLSSIAAGGLLVYLQLHQLMPVQLLVYSELNILSDYTLYILITCLFTTVAIRRIEKSTARIESELQERKMAEEELRKRDEQYRAITGSSMDGFWLTGSEGRILDVNDAYCRISGYTRAEILEMHIKDFDAIESPEDMKRRRESIMEIGSDRFESQHRCKDGRIIDVEVSATKLPQADLSIGFIRDVTERKREEEKRERLEKQLMQSQRLEAVGTLSAGIAHDFNNILNIILGNASLLAEHPEDRPKTIRRIDAITKATERGAQLVRQLLTFARKTVTDRRPILVNDSIRELSKLLEETFPKTITITLRLELGLPFVVADPNQIHQVLLNMSVNARDAMPQGGMICFSTAVVGSEYVGDIFSGSDSSPYVEITIRDNGVGMDEETRRRIFDPFFTTKEVGKGTGLGLATAHGIIEDHGGFIDVTSKPGDGTEFRIYLPIAGRVGELEKEPAPDVAAKLRGTETLLFIEDEGLVRESALVHLERMGYRVITAADGEEGVRIFREHEKEIALVLSDYGLPKFDGAEVCRRIRQSNPAVHFLLMTGFIEPKQRNEVAKLGVSGVVEKPYKPADLVKRIRGLLDA